MCNIKKLTKLIHDWQILFFKTFNIEKLVFPVSWIIQKNWC